MCTPPASKRIPPSLRVVVVVGGVDTVDNRSPCRSGPVFCPPDLGTRTVDNRGPLWTSGSCAHPMHRYPGVLPSCVPRNTQVLPRPTHHLGVTPFTLPGDEPGFVAEQWTQVWRSGPSLCTTPGILWAGGGQPRSGPVGVPFPSTVCGCGLPTYPHAVELREPPSDRLACGGDSGQLRCPQGVDGPYATLLWRNGSAAGSR